MNAGFGAQAPDSEGRVRQGACSFSCYRFYAERMSKDTSTRGASGILAGGGILTGLSALIGASCCVLPILLVQIGVSAVVIAHLAWFAQAKPYLPGLTAVLVLAGFTSAFWSGRRPRPLVLVALIGAAILTMGAIAMPHYERELLGWMRSR